jgi:hypothetical protein
MDFGPYSLPTLAILIVVVVIFVAGNWIFDGMKAEDEGKIFDPAPTDPDDKIQKGPLPRF